MIEYVKHIALFLIIALLANGFLYLIDSNYVVDFLSKNLLTIQLGVFAINIAIISLILSKISELRKKNDDFDHRFIISSLKESLLEQIILIICGFVFISFLQSNTLKSCSYYDILMFVIESILIAIFINVIQILYDTGNGIFILSENEDEL